MHRKNECVNAPLGSLITNFFGSKEKNILETFKKIFIGSLGITLAKTGGVIIFGNKV